MIESVLSAKKLSTGRKISVKTVLSFALVALAVGLPQLVHLIAGASGGAAWLPMYLPVLLGGCLLGMWWGMGIGILSPLVSFAITALAGNAMPAASRLPYMVAELALISAVSGAFSKRILSNPWTAFAAVLLAFVGGRLFFLTLAAIFESVSPLSVQAAWAQIKTGLAALVLQAVIVPAIVIGAALLLKREQKDASENSEKNF